jgi:hypothetical protein
MKIPTNHPGIYANLRNQNPNEEFAGQVNRALDTIASRPNGRALLRSIAEAHARTGHSTAVHQVTCSPYAVPVLSTRQRRAILLPKEELSTSMFVADDIPQGPRNASGCTEGSDALVGWNPRESLDINALGQAVINLRNPQDDFVGLAHELVHAKRTMTGEDLGDEGDCTDPTTPLGIEEAIATGLPLGPEFLSLLRQSENGVRMDHGQPLRTQYAVASEPAAEWSETEIPTPSPSPTQFGSPER